MIQFRKFFTTLIVVAFVFMLFAFSEISYAQNEHRRSGWWGGIEIGIGYVELSSQEYKESDTHFYLGFSGGYTINSSLQFGCELSGWLYEASNLNDYRKGEGISQMLVIARYYPFKNKDFFTKFGCGYVSLWDNDSSETDNDGGMGLNLGVGYDLKVNDNWAISPFLSYNYGDIGHLEYKAFTLGITILFH